MTAATRSSSRLKKSLEGILRSPLRLRVAVGVLLVGTWYFASYQPLVEQIATRSRRLANERKRLDLAVEIERLRHLTRQFQARLPRTADQNEVVQYLVGGIRQRPIKLLTLEPKTTTELGPYRLIQVFVCVEGSYASLEALVRWIETDPHLFRIELIEIEPSKEQSGHGQSRAYSLALNVLGVVG
jgi:hypothetical protein